MSETFVKTLKRDYVRVKQLPDAQTVLRLVGDWIEDYYDNHRHSGLSRSRAAPTSSQADINSDEVRRLQVAGTPNLDS